MDLLLLLLMFRDFGVHVDGFIVVLAHTVILSEGKTITGTQADLLACAMECLNAAGKLLRPGVTVGRKFLLFPPPSLLCHPFLLLLFIIIILEHSTF